MRSPARALLMAVSTLLAILAGWYIWITPGLKPVVVSIYEPPIISADSLIKDLGQVQTDSKVHTKFLLYNIGGKHLRILDVDTSCGCTLAEVSKRVVAPGDFTRIEVALDTRIKMGKIRKEVTVRSNDPRRPVLSLFLTGEVLGKAMAGHGPLVLKPEDRLVLFKGDCATCHVSAGKGKTGKALFLADCAMCHGGNAQGNHSAGPSLLGGNYDDEAFRKAMRAVIADGSPRSPQMPPFSKAKGGPLTSGEIDSLVSFLQFQNLQQKMGLLNRPDTEALEHEEAFQKALQEQH